MRGERDQVIECEYLQLPLLGNNAPQAGAGRQLNRPIQAAACHHVGAACSVSIGTTRCSPQQTHQNATLCLERLSTACRYNYAFYRQYTKDVHASVLLPTLLMMCESKGPLGAEHHPHSPHAHTRGMLTNNAHLVATLRLPMNALNAITKYGTALIAPDLGGMWN